MDTNGDILEVQYSERESYNPSSLGLRTCIPINRDTYTEEQWEELWENVRKCDYAFEDTTRGDKYFFFQGVAAEGTYNFEIPGKAFGQLANAGPKMCAVIHFMVFDEIPTSQLVNAGREILDFAFQHLKVHRVTATIPSFNQRVLRMAALLHMKFEGSMKQAFLYEGSWWNLEIHSILEGEYARGRM